MCATVCVQVCLRFVAICRLLHEQEDRDSTVGWSAHVAGAQTPLARPPAPATGTTGATGEPLDRRRAVPVIIPPEEVRGWVGG